MTIDGTMEICVFDWGLVGRFYAFTQKYFVHFHCPSDIDILVTLLLNVIGKE